MTTAAKAPALTRGDAIALARDIQTNPGDYAFLDTETTDVNEAAEVVEVALVDFHGDVLFNERINPCGFISEESQAVHGISLEQVKNCRRWEQVRPDLLRALGDRLMIIYNKTFDLRVMTQSDHLIPHAMDSSVFGSDKAVCLMSHRIAFEGRAKQKLIGGDHSSVGDCEAMIDLVQSWLYAQERPELAQAPADLKSLNPVELVNLLDQLSRSKKLLQQQIDTVNGEILDRVKHNNKQPITIGDRHIELVSNVVRLKPKGGLETLPKARKLTKEQTILDKSKVLKLIESNPEIAKRLFAWETSEYTRIVKNK